MLFDEDSNCSITRSKKRYYKTLAPASEMVLDEDIVHAPWKHGENT